MPKKELAREIVEEDDRELLDCPHCKKPMDKDKTDGYLFCWICSYKHTDWPKVELSADE